jgi:outer membrane immunogenic protein
MSKRLLSATTTALALISTHPALSADLGPIAPVYKTAPVVPQTPFFTWTGCYIGAHVGGGLARKTFTTPPVTFAPPPLTSDAREFSFDPGGFVGGGQFGCNYQFSQEWVVGVEANIEGADIQGSKIDTHSDIDTSNSPVITTNTFGLGAHSKSPWLASVTARIGWAPGPWFIYVKGGGAWISDKYTADLSVTQMVSNGSTTSTATEQLAAWSAHETRAGWVFGGGIEYAFLTYWSARFDYGYYYFGNRNLTFTGLDSPVVNVKEWMSVFTIGISYRFGPGPTSYYY